MSEKIALIGAGAMGGAIGTRFLETKNSLCVFDLDREKVDALIAKGAYSAASAAEAASQADFVITSLNSSKIVGLAAFGDKGIADGAKRGTVVIDMSSTDPGSTSEFAAKAQERGFAWVDAPLSGGAPKALIGELTLMLGGDEEHVARAKVALRHVATNMTHMGGPGCLLYTSDAADE